jgi:uncharacterized damage-inducible protein DinB
MNEVSFPPIDITRHWETLTDHLVEIVEAIPDGLMNWSPSPNQWNYRGVLLHIAGARHHWLANVIRDGEATPDLFRQGQTRDGMIAQLQLSWERLARFLSSPLEARGYLRAPDRRFRARLLRRPLEVRRPLHRLPPAGARCASQS